MGGETWRQASQLAFFVPEEVEVGRGDAEGKLGSSPPRQPLS
jgi:hypothetical protein